MSDAERAQKLRVLLAKVQANAALSVPGRPPPKKLDAWPTDETFTSFPDSEYPSTLPRPPDEDEREFSTAALKRRYQSEDRWTSLLSGALEPHEAKSTLSSSHDAVDPPVRDEPEPSHDATHVERPARDERPPVEVDAPLMPATSFASIPPAPAALAHPSDPPTSALVRAIAKVAKERAVELGRSDEIWGDVLVNLRERRSPSRPDLAAVALPSAEKHADEGAAPAEEHASTPSEGSARGEPPAPPEPEAFPLTTRASVEPLDAEADLDGAPLSRRPRHRMRVLSGGARRPAERTSTTRRILGWSLVAATMAGVAIASAVFVPKWLSGTPSPLNEPLSKVESNDAPDNSSAKPQNSVAAAQPVASARPNASTDPTAPANTAELPPNMGYVLFLSERPLHVYVNGRLEGETGEWLRVDCDYRNVRFSERSVPKLGEAFPVWAGEGHTVIVPCRAATKFDAVAR